MATIKPTPGRVAPSNISKIEKFTRPNNSTFQYGNTWRNTVGHPLFPGQDRQYCAIIPSQNYLLTSPAHELDTVIPAAHQLDFQQFGPWQNH